MGAPRWVPDQPGLSQDTTPTASAPDRPYDGAVDFLVVAPPVCPPSEPPSGAFLLAAGLTGHGADCGMLDLSLELYWQLLSDGGEGETPTARALRYLLDSAGGYDGHRHRSAAGVIRSHLRGFGQQNPGWRISPMDVVAPRRVHDPRALAELLDEGPSPFEPLWQGVLARAIERHRPRTVLISLAYLSQLAATIDLVRHLEGLGVKTVVGGSLPRSLAATGEGLGLLRERLGNVDIGDGLSLLGTDARLGLLSRLAWPRLLSRRPYLTSRPIVPLALSTGCFWNRCLFCPDRDMPFTPVTTSALQGLLSTMPEPVRAAGPIVHLLDSAVPPAGLRRFLPLAREHQLGFYAFARPTERLRQGDLLAEAAESGCLMLQLGAEGGSGPLLRRFDKGLDPTEAEAVMREAAQVGIRTYLYLLFGLPGETESDRRATLELIARNAESVDFLNLSVFNLPRHSELTDRAGEFGIELEDFPADAGLRLYRPFRSQGQDTRAEAKAFLQRELRPHPSIRGALLRTPRWFRAAHLALMHVDGRRALRS